MREVIDAGDSPSLPPKPPPAQVPSRTPLSRTERVGLGVTSLVESGVFAWAYVLPWDKFTLFGVLCVSLSACNALLCVSLAVSPLERFQQPLWRVTSGLSVLVFGWGTWAVFSSAWYLSQLYAGLGQGLSAALFAIWGLLLLVTIPTAAWGFARTRGSAFTLPFRVASSALVIATLLGSAAPQTAEQDASEGDWYTLLATQVAPAVQSLPQVPANPNGDSPNAAKRPTACEVPPSEEQTAIVFYRDRASRFVAHCYQARSLQELAAEVTSGLAEQAALDLVLIDRITGTRQLRSHSPLLDPLMLRPGLDGGCMDRWCFAPWQLVAQGAFTTHAPLAFLADLKFGLSLDTLRKQLKKKAESEASLVAIETQSVSITANGELTRLRRHHPEHVALTQDTANRATAGYAAHIVAAQQTNGQFRYTLDPFSGKAEFKNFSIPRQAGTLLVLCELGQATPEVEQTIRRGLQLLRDHRRTRDDHWALSLEKDAKVVRLGDSALPLVAFATCRRRVGSQFDEAIRGLSQFVLSQQQPDGSFTSSYDWNKRRKLPGPEALYAPGQALLGLTLLDALILEAPDEAALALGKHEQLTEAIQRGMAHVANTHWDMAMYPFFFIEENWNCLAARAALLHQRNDAYERFCIDYMQFKSRLIFDETSNVAEEFLGGFGFGNVIPPHNTGAAGVGEAMAALISVKQARNEDTTRDESLLTLLLQFLLRQQWTPETCYGCAPDVVGSMSEHMHSPITRIDFTQHAWAAVGHGSKVLGITTP